MIPNIEIVFDIGLYYREVYIFTLFDLDLVCCSLLRQSKEKGKRKWTTITKWDRRDLRFSSIPEPVLSSVVKERAFKELSEMIKVISWSEWKNK